MSRSEPTRRRSISVRGRLSHHLALVGGELALFTVELEVVAVQHGIQAVLGNGGQAHHLAALGDHRPQVAHGLGWDPHPFQQPGGVQLGQGQGGLLVRLDLHPHHQGHVGRVNGGHGMNLAFQAVAEQVGVGGHLQHHCILRGQAALDPGFQFVVEHGLGTEDRLHLASTPTATK